MSGDWSHLHGSEYMRHVLRHGSARKLRLFAVAHCRMIWIQFTDPLCRGWVELAESFADDLVSNEDRRNAAEAAYQHASQLSTRGLAEGTTWSEQLPFFASATDVSHTNYQDAICWSIAMAAANALNEDPAHSTWAAHRIENVFRILPRTLTKERRECYRLAPEVFGLDPTNPVAFDPRWLSESAVALARTAYNTRDFTLLPILADALEEAGCDHPDVLTHCRNPNGVHVRGCWVVDAVLGKE